ncbi:hypothetical protein C922_03261 [Plasmodium inui San Antonio 1]|uniref:Obg domain-containing protein n=1 Tax=Plasmodium inui San Antonio 1 TaxID=1237626 RepID=W7A3W5_9APIC|nr:hypothetical protein C922_03261 [Plasmodium inui San Antonio 1]EUD66345.1 hypothetical protein C922_03261 [Plasmodium inui San Antonio 1]
MGALSLPTKGRRLYSIKIIDRVTKKSVKIYEHSSFGRNGKGKKSDEECPHPNGESTFPTDGGLTWGEKYRGTPMVGVKSDVCRMSTRKTSIFYESERIIKCESGAGGDGAISFKKFKRKVLGPLGIPNGGKGGNGGDVYLCYWDREGGGPLTRRRKRRGEDQHVYINNLEELPCVISATRGEKGKANQLRGKNGMSVFLHVNKMCHVYRLFPRGGEDATGREGAEATCRGGEEATCREVPHSECTDVPLHILGGHTYDAQGTPLGDERRDVLMIGRNDQWASPHVKGDHHNVVAYKSQYEDKVYKVIKKEDPIYVKKNMHILKQLIRMDKQVGGETYLGMLSPRNNSLLLSKGGEGGKGNNMQDTYTYGKGATGSTSYIRIVYRCISDTCLLGFPGSGKSTLLSLIAPKIHTVNNMYVLKKIFFTDNFQVSVADFVGDCTGGGGISHGGGTSDGGGISDGGLISDSSRTPDGSRRAEQSPPFHISPNVAHHLELIHLLVIVLDMHRELIPQFRAIREELRRKDERLFLKPYIVAINKCDAHFAEKIKRAEEAYRDIKAEAGDDVPVFFISAKYAMGIDKFVTHLRTCVQKLKQAIC